MELILLELVRLLKVRPTENLTRHQIDNAIRLGNKLRDQNEFPERFPKRALYPFYAEHIKNNPGWLDEHGVDAELEQKLLLAIQMKPRRTASGVATITVMTKPWPCGSECIYCPNDLRMPKSYLTDEPVCQRAERIYFDPFLQVTERLQALSGMGHSTDKVELIILGGTWSDYPETYQIWFVRELFRALNEFGGAADGANSGATTDTEVGNSTAPITAHYQACGLKSERDELAALVESEQQKVDSLVEGYNEGWANLYKDTKRSGLAKSWQAVSETQSASWEELEREQELNEASEHRVVGLVIETRPDTITVSNLLTIRRLGATKVQIGIQSLNPEVLAINNRNIPVDKIAEAFSLLRLFGFKIHAHFMVNLLGQTAASDIADYSKFVSDPRFLPDEVKLYPCALVGSTPLVKKFESGEWVPYSEEELIKVLVEDTLATPRYCRISRMIRDISAHDIIAGNKKGNLRQLVENRIEEQAKANGRQIQEIRWREIADGAVDISELELKCTVYQTAVAEEHFLEWVTPDDKIAGFLRLSLPLTSATHFEGLPVDCASEAIIREVHVYGKSAKLDGGVSNSQHHGLGKRLIEVAAETARVGGFKRLNVISAVGTREYYRNRGFTDTKSGLYQQLAL